jgi:hypothetical protein
MLACPQSDSFGLPMGLSLFLFSVEQCSVIGIQQIVKLYQSYIVMHACNLSIQKTEAGEL